ncbi:MAG: FtsX-like permease family protein [Ruminococcus sp.]|nr:FtsX-like permease family protein [Ruminococcus sp.]
MSSFIVTYHRTFYNGVVDYTAGVSELNDGIDELHDSMPDLIDNASELRDAALEFAEHTAELKDGVNEFSDAIGDFNDNIDELDEFFDIDIDIIETFEPLSFHTGVQNTADRNMSTAETCGIIVFMIIAFIFTVFISHEIDNESSVIGAMYSMGVKKWSLIRHYLIIPVIISLTGGTIGTVIGLSPLGVGLLSESTESFYSLPEFVSHIDYRIVAMGVLAPVLISAVVTVIIANKKLSNSPLSILRHEKKYVRSRQEILILCRLLLHSE